VPWHLAGGVRCICPVLEARSSHPPQARGIHTACQMHLVVERSIQPAASTTRIYHPRMLALDAGHWMWALDAKKKIGCGGTHLTECWIHSPRPRCGLDARALPQWCNRHLTSISFPTIRSATGAVSRSALRARTRFVLPGTSRDTYWS
jgi:hypothetical protein